MADVLYWYAVNILISLTYIPICVFPKNNNDEIITAAISWELTELCHVYLD